MYKRSKEKSRKSVVTEETDHRGNVLADWLFLMQNNADSGNLLETTISIFINFLFIYKKIVVAKFACYRHLA